jgi:hypothetical protein
MINLRRCLRAPIFAVLIASGAAHAQPGVSPGTSCALLPSFCELHDQVLDTEQCKCVPHGSQVGTPCLLVPSFCELHGKTLDTNKCKCVPEGPDLAGICQLTPSSCEQQSKTLDANSCACVGPDKSAPAGDAWNKQR